MNTIKNILFGIMLLGMSSSFNVQAVSSGSFKLAGYKEEVAIMMKYINTWDGKDSDQELNVKVIDWMKKRVKNQDIPAVLLLEISQLLSNTEKSDEDKMQAMFDIIQKNKEVRKKIKIKRKMAKATKQEKQQKQNKELATKKAQSEKQRLIRLVKDTVIKTTVETAMILSGTWLVTHYFG